MGQRSHNSDQGVLENVGLGERDGVAEGVTVVVGDNVAVIEAVAFAVSVEVGVRVAGWVWVLVGVRVGGVADATRFCKCWEAVRNSLAVSDAPFRS